MSLTVTQNVNNLTLTVTQSGVSLELNPTILVGEFDGVIAANIPIVDAGNIITSSDVEGALQENRTAIDLNTAKVTNVSTKLSEGTATETTVNIDSSDGTNATLVSATTIRAGVMSKAKFDEVEANTTDNLSQDGKIDAYRYESRVGIDGGRVDNISGLITELPNVTTESLVMLPSGYKATKLYNQVPTQPDPKDFTVARNSLKTRVNESGIIEEVAIDTPSIDYTDGDGVLLTEPQSANLVTYSEQFDDASWLKGGASIVANSIIAPDGNLTADEFVVDVLSFHRAIQILSTTTTAGEFYTFSVYIKNNNTTAVPYLRLQSNSGDDLVKNINITNDWARYEITLEITGSGTDLIPFIHSNDSEGVGNSFYIWGAQLDQLSYPTSYIPTAGATVTRLADVITIAPPTGVTSNIETIDTVAQTPITVIPATYTIPEGNINTIIML